MVKLPVFTADTEQKIREYCIEERQWLEQIRQEIFEAGGQDEKMELEKIRSQIFKAAQGVPEPARYERTEALQGISPEMAAIGCMVLLLGMWRILQRKFFHKQDAR